MWYRLFDQISTAKAPLYACFLLYNIIGILMHTSRHNRRLLPPLLVAAEEAPSSSQGFSDLGGM